MSEYDYTEQETRTQHILPKLHAAGWDKQPHSIGEERTFTDGRILVVGNRTQRGKRKKADYILRYHPDMPIAVVEAKPYDSPKGEGLQQAKEYAKILDLKFAYATNGREIVEFDFLTGLQREMEEFPTPDELWQRIKVQNSIDVNTERHLLTPSRYDGNKQPRYYQEIAVNRVVQAIGQGQRRVLLTMATGTGKTFVAFQICWKLWNSRWNKTGSHRKPRILFLADRNVLVDDPKDKTFVPFGDARWKIEHGHAVKSREIYFATYQAIARDERRPGLYREYTKDFFDLIIVDEAHRGSARDDSNWREILEYFAPAYQLGLTATPRREENRNTYEYFGDPVYQYSLRQGIADGFLAPFTVHRIATDVDVLGWRPNSGQLDRYRREIPDREYGTADYERDLVLSERTRAIANHIGNFMEQHGRHDKTVVFCVDQEHALQMQHELNNLSTDLVREEPNYVVRITGADGDRGRGLLSEFQDPRTNAPIIVTTSKLLTTGVDIPTCKNIVIVRPITSMTEFKQIIGRGTRVRDDFDKLFFNILDYTGSATTLFADPAFDGPPVEITEIGLDKEGAVASEEVVTMSDLDTPDVLDEIPPDTSGAAAGGRKYYVDDVAVEIVAELAYYYDESGTPIRIEKYIDHTAEQVRILYSDAASMRHIWADSERRDGIMRTLEDRGVMIEHLANVMKQPDADPLDLLCHLAFNTPIRSRKDRKRRVIKEEQAFFEQYSTEAREILNELLKKYATYGLSELILPGVLETPPISNYGNISEIIDAFDGPDALVQAFQQLQELLYAA